MHVRSAKAARFHVELRESVAAGVRGSSLVEASHLQQVLEWGLATSIQSELIRGCVVGVRNSGGARTCEQHALEWGTSRDTYWSIFAGQPA